VLHDRGFKSITDAVSDIAERPTTMGWKIAFAISLGMLSMLGVCILYLITTGVGVWGNNQPASWGFPIVNFVFWVGIGHAGTLISAILFLFRQNWRTGINRFAEAMTIFAVMCGCFVPRDSRRPRLACILALPDPQPDEHVAAVSQPAAVGRVCGRYLCHGFDPLLVRRHGARPGHPS